MEYIEVFLNQLFNYGDNNLDGIYQNKYNNELGFLFCVIIDFIVRDLFNYVLF